MVFIIMLLGLLLRVSLISGGDSGWVRFFEFFG